MRWTQQRAVEVIAQIEPRIIVPMHYATPAYKTNGAELDPVDKFCREMGVEVMEPLPKLVITRATLPTETASHAPQLPRRLRAG